MIIRLVELGIEGSPTENMHKFSEAAVIPPVPDAAVFPELYSTGFVLDDIDSLALSVEELSDLRVASTAREDSLWIIGGTVPVKTDDGVVNRMVVYSPEGTLAYQTDKVHIFKQMGEDRAFIPGKCAGTFPFMGTTGAGIVCYDLRFPELSRRLVLAGAEIIFVPAQWPGGRMELFRSLLRARAAEAQIFTVGCNLGGEHLGVIFGGSGGVAHPEGKMIKGHSVMQGITDFKIDLTDAEEMRKYINCLEDRRPQEYGTLSGREVTSDR